MVTGDRTVDEALEQLTHIMAESEIYRKYISIRQEVAKQPGLQQQIDDFRRRNYEVQMNYQGDELLARVEEMEHISEELRKNPLVDQYLAAELAFCRMIQGMNEFILASLDFK